MSQLAGFISKRQIGCANRMSMTRCHAKKCIGSRPRSNVLGAGLVLITVMAGMSCLRTNATETELKNAQAEWTTRLTALKNRQADLAAQLQSRQPSDNSVNDLASRRRLEAAVIGGQQAVDDIEREVQRIGTEVGAASSPADTLLEARVRMADYLAAQEEALATAQGQLALVQQGGGGQ